MLEIKATPAPGAHPGAAVAYYGTGDGTEDAWLAAVPGADPVGYLRMDTEDPDSVVAMSGEDWAALVAERGMTELDLALAGKAKGGGKAPPFGKPDKGGGDDPPSISTGSFVSWKGGKGRVDLVVRTGTVPGVDPDDGGDEKANPGSPLARVVVWEQDGDTWKASRKKIAERVATLKRIPPLAGAKVSPGAGVPAALVAMHAAYGAHAEATGVALPDGHAVTEVFARGVKAWPGEDCGLGAEEWGLARVASFLDVATGGQSAGYTRDDDLLPA